MTTDTLPATAAPTAARTRTLLGLGALAGPVYLAVGLIQALTREGFDLGRHALSLLANGDLGWIHIANLVGTGLLTVAGAVGIRRALPGTRWGPRLLAAYGVSLIGAGIFVADPADGFPVGTPAGPPAAVSWHGLLHFAVGGVGFLCLVVACFLLARALDRRWATFTRAAGLIFLAGFAAISSGVSTPPVLLAFWLGVVAAWTWLSALSLHLARRWD